MMTYPEVTEIKIQEEMAKFLKCQTGLEAVGGRGENRKNFSYNFACLKCYIIFK